LPTDPGLYACWNIAVKMAKGKYLNNANVDDIKKIDSISLMCEYLDNNPKINLVYGDSLISKVPNLTYDKALLTCKERFCFPNFTYDNLIDCNPPHHSPLYRKELHKKYGYFEETMNSASDWEFWLRVAREGALMSKIDEITGVYYLNPKGVSTNSENLDWKSKEESLILKKYNINNITPKGNTKRIKLNNQYFKY
jgi:hypothetical protein